MRIPVSLLAVLVGIEATSALSSTKMPRRSILVSVTAIVTGALPLASTAETIGKDPNCNDRSCLGVWDGLFADCPHNIAFSISGANCASSQDDTPGIFAEPWDFGDFDSLDYEDQMRRLIPVIQLVSAKRGDTVDILLQKERYLRVRFRDGKTSENSIGEFYFTPNDTTVQFRVGSVNESTLLSLRNLERCELIRTRMGYQKLPVLRNRKQAFFFGESDLDTFGPGSAALGPPAEMSNRELEGR